MCVAGSPSSGAPPKPPSLLPQREGRRPGSASGSKRPDPLGPPESLPSGVACASAASVPPCSPPCRHPPAVARPSPRSGAARKCPQVAPRNGKETRGCPSPANVPPREGLRHMAEAPGLGRGARAGGRAAAARRRKARRGHGHGRRRVSGGSAGSGGGGDAAPRGGPGLQEPTSGEDEPCSAQAATPRAAARGRRPQMPGRPCVLYLHAQPAPRRAGPS